MPRKKQVPDEILTTENEGSVTSPSETQPKPEIKPRLSVPLKLDGSIDYDAMQDRSREKLQRALAASGSIGPVAFPALRVNRDFIPHMYDSMCAGIQLAGQKLFHWPQELTTHMQFTPEEKEKLTEPTAKVLEKHAPAWLLSHQEEFALVQAIITCSKSMVERATYLYILSKDAQPKPPAPEPTE
jgi:hypothetical protein